MNSLDERTILTAKQPKDEPNCRGWAARDESGILSPYEFYRRPVGDDDVFLRITHCGVCYADVIYTRNIHNSSMYPTVPGHEIVGVVEKVGANVTKFKIGDHAGVETYVDSCRDCKYCDINMEVYCSKGCVYTISGTNFDGTPSQGGYSSFIVVHERYCYTIPEKLPPSLAAPLLCAGITVYSPMMRHGMNQAGKSLGVIGMGGLGHMAVKFGKAFGLHVTVLSTSLSKKDDALNKLKADRFVLSSNKEEMESISKSLDFIIDTASGDHPMDAYLPLLKVGGILALVGAPSGGIKFHPINFLIGMKSISGSTVGGTKQTQEMIDFCAEHGIYPEIEVIPIEYANEALERLIKGDVKYRFVIDIANSLK
ncbi:hypothetical protein MLD38_026565 [Melastoma candidum]|uniref:Uncharacterized protein n=1 Tax=Melastoma candidum TaxID=119954 RepID=A0ACB9NYV0_9MYRT|nr:hypothetical protein MLD38_026565 [Melastoma candidum]